MATTDSIYPIESTESVTQNVQTKYSLFQNNARAWMTLILTFSDTIALLLTLLIATNIHKDALNELNDLFYIHFLWIPIVLLIFIYSNSGLYPSIGVSAVEEVRKMTLSTSLLFMIVITLTFFLKVSGIYSRLVFLLAWGLALLMIPLARTIMRWVCAKLQVWGEPVAIVGFPDRRVFEVANFFEKFPQKGMVPRAIFVESMERMEPKYPCEVLPAFKIDQLAEQLRLDTILVVVPNWNWVGDNLDRYHYLFKRVILIRPQRENFSLSESVAIDFNGVTGFQVCHNLLDPWAMLLKRAIDLVASTLGFLILLPFLSLIALLIHLDSPGSIFYRQERIGKGGKSFSFLKFRTMRIDGDQIFAARLKEDKAFRDEWKRYQKVKHDPRITRVGGFLRKFSLDELPQIWNILKGEMSVVGPRPMMLNQKEMYGPSFHDYTQVRPGITGLWQVSGRNHTTFARRAELDMEYIQRWSVWLDLYIGFQTIKEVISNDDAY